MCKPSLSDGYYRYPGRARCPEAAQGIYFIYLFSYGIAENSVAYSVDERDLDPSMFHILMQDALEILQLIWQLKTLWCIISGRNLFNMQVY